MANELQRPPNTIMGWSLSAIERVGFPIFVCMVMGYVAYRTFNFGLERVAAPWVERQIQLSHAIEDSQKTIAEAVKQNADVAAGQLETLEQILKTSNATAEIVESVAASGSAQAQTLEAIKRELTKENRPPPDP